MMTKEKEMKSFIKKLSTVLLFGFVMSSPVFGKGDGNYSSHLNKQGGESRPEPEAAPSQNITVNSNYGVLTQYHSFLGNLTPLIPVAQNSDNTYTLHTSDQGTRYYLADASGNTIGDYQEGPAFAGKSTWTLNADGKTSTIS